MHPSVADLSGRSSRYSGHDSHWRVETCHRREGQVCRWTFAGHAAKVLSRRWKEIDGTIPPPTMLTDERCQDAPGSVAPTAATSPAWASLVTSLTPERPRAVNDRQNASQLLPVAVDEDVGVISGGDERGVRTAPLGVVSGAVVVLVTGSSSR